MNLKQIIFRLAFTGWLVTALNALAIETVALGQGIGFQTGQRTTTQTIVKTTLNGLSGHGASLKTQEPESTVDKQQDERFAAFEELLTNSKLVGRFTVLGDDDRELREEVYFIDEITKMEKGDYWLFKARLKYEGNDFSAPLPLEVQWAGDTPVITLTDFTIPGLGTFDSRVLFYNKKYAGTWTHGEIGGHLFGMIEPAEDGAASEEETSSGKTSSAPAAGQSEGGK